ncbi:MAG TPA: glutaredoxin family protein [Promineifilum sp.]|nr:glutaredoxin family protein [Promineifilum sp.]
MDNDQSSPDKTAQALPPIIVYGRPGCPGVGPVLRLLDAAEAAYAYVDIRQDPGAAARLREITGGYESVPTVVLPDGRAMVEPGTLKLRQALQEQAPAGEEVVTTGEAVRAGLSNPVYLILTLIAVALIMAVWVSM